MSDKQQIVFLKEHYNQLVNKSLGLLSVIEHAENNHFNRVTYQGESITLVEAIVIYEMLNNKTQNTDLKIQLLSGGYLKEKKWENL